MDIKIEYKLFDIRSKRGYTVRSLAEKSGVSKSNINNIENQESNPSILVIVKLARALEVEPDDLYYVK
jgi:putative transcriptional regulator